jgi:negative modulator of initiation of replication
MPPFELTPEVRSKLVAVAETMGCSPSELVASLLSSPAFEAQNSPIVGYTLSAEFRAKATDAERYLALLAWVATHNAPEFSDFIAHQSSGRRYLGLSPEEIRETCQHNQARPIAGTHYWAIMNLDTATKRRFLRRLLVFVGEPDEVINHVTATIGGR